MVHKFDKSKLPSRHVTEGPERAPHRSYYYAMGLSEQEIQGHSAEGRTNHPRSASRPSHGDPSSATDGSRAR